MSLPFIDDPNMPGLRLAGDPAAFTTAIAEALRNTTAGQWHCDGVRVDRFRYRAGARAILQLTLVVARNGEQAIHLPGALWLHAGKTAKATGPDRVDPMDLPRTLRISGGLLTLFPHDRKVPGIEEFVRSPARRAHALIGDPMTDAPCLARYRPGIGATFRWQGRRTAYVKIDSDRPASDRFRDLDRLHSLCDGQRLATPEPLGFSDAIGAVAIAEVQGTFLGDILRHDDRASVESAIATIIAALSNLNALAVPPRRTRDARDLLRRARCDGAADRCRRRVAGRPRRRLCRGPRQ